MHACACKQCIFQSYNTSTVNAVCFNENPFACQCQKKEEKKGLRVLNFALSVVVFNWHHGSEVVNHHRDGWKSIYSRGAFFYPSDLSAQKHWAWSSQNRQGKKSISRWYCYRSWHRVHQLKTGGISAEVTCRWPVVIRRSGLQVHLAVWNLKRLFLTCRPPSPPPPPPATTTTTLNTTDSCPSWW